MKTYLKDLTPEEIIKRLKNGEILYPVNPDYHYKMIDGVLCEFFNNKLYNINVQVGSVYRPDSNEGYDYYFETEEPFEIKETGLYKTRDGRKVFVSCIINECLQPVRGIIQGEDVTTSWYLSGEYEQCDKSDEDIISKWEEKLPNITVKI